VQVSIETLAYVNQIKVGFCFSFKALSLLNMSREKCDKSAKDLIRIRILVFFPINLIGRDMKMKVMFPQPRRRRTMVYGRNLICL